MARSAFESLLQPFREPGVKRLRAGIGNKNESAVRGEAETGAAAFICASSG